MKTAALNNKDILSHKFRFEAEHYLNDNSFLCLALERNKDNCDSLENLATVFNPPVFKRQFCKPTTRSVQYFQSSDVQNAEESSPVHIFKGQAESLNLLVNKGDVLVTGFGTIGNTRLVSKHQDGVCYANNVCRIRANNNIPNGFIYAFMTSKYGYAQLNNNASGSVVRYIEAPGIKRTLVPRISETFQMRVDDLIQETTRLRANAADALNKAHELIVKQFSIAPSHAPHCIVSSKTIFSSQLHRFDSNYYVADGKYYDTIIKTTFHWKTLGDVSERIWRPDIFKRAYVKNGIPFLSSSDIMLSIPQSEKQISRRMPNSEAFLVDEKWILVPRSGTIGEVVYTTSQHAQKLVSEDVIRIVPNDILSSGYVYAFLSSSIGKALIQRLIFGSVIQHIEPPLLETIPIPILSDVQMDEIAELAEIHRTCWGKAAELELEAISLVESEIEKWNN